MRCNFCNVDLEDAQQSCPLCGKPAANEEPRVKRVTSPYPTHESLASRDANDTKKTKKPTT
ncbi:MAG TPA: hypothetical protein VFD23_05725 [Clostridia bacterium]|nr:hypothetical protein [Clostridia bacterium]